jgi:hypothetical protein
MSSKQRLYCAEIELKKVSGVAKPFSEIFSEANGYKCVSKKNGY